MCGIAGVWSFGGSGEESLRARAQQMADTLRHRGPDDEGIFTDAEAGIGLGFRRLSIVDLSRAGAQPMVSASGRYVMVFNGEVYNHRRLVVELGAHDYRGHSDTEVMLECIEAWGLETAVQRFIGMFAFAVWDRSERKLSLVRDRLGVKPLYYKSTPNGIAFASELKALHSGVADGGDIDRGALALYIRFGYVPAPYSIYDGIAKLLPGTILTIDSNGAKETRTYWDAARVAEAASNRFTGTEDEAVDEIEALLSDSVRLRLISDVPLGLFLSGGIDSPLIAALMQREAGSVSTFTIGFDGIESEAPFAAAIARHLGTNHTEVVIGANEALALVPLMASLYDEPLGDSSAIPTYLVSRMARQHVTVALSGDGADELFGGYHRYFLGRRSSERVRRVPRLLRRPLGSLMLAAARLPSRQNFRARLRGFGDSLVIDDPITLFQEQVDSTETIRVLAAQVRPAQLTARMRWPRLQDPSTLMMYLDAISYLPDDILAKVDRASMAVSLEVREPMLDHRLVELAWSLPLSMKIRGTDGKWVLRRLLKKFLPAEMVDRDKQGFGLPIDKWLHGPLREWAASLVDPKRIAREGWFDPTTLRHVWNDGPIAGREQVLWRVLMFQQWLSR
ncbi:MAG TPA: asparagine synthase (glutamine-hydrolyzing) [Thermoanaerobaculia bacterium]|jgi:asparagine synthase (glutamine-hydrolysing)|nr:asparagine synthase (glutamine-hydrolyzing) [Thermoanaerobaculia bacterium]